MNPLNRRSFINTTALSFGSALIGSVAFPGFLGSSCQSKRGNTVSTLIGEIDCNMLGTTLMHEHVLFFSGPRLDNSGYTPIPDDLRNETVDFAVSMLNDAARVGINTVVDLTPYRPIELYDQIAKRTQVKIIASTGFYRRAKIPGLWAEMEDQKQMEDLLRKELTEGIDGTGIKAGIIKVAAESLPLTDWEKKVFQAAAKVNKINNAPIATHVGTRTQFDFLINAGANPNQLLLSHVDTGRRGRTLEQFGEELISIAKEGGYLEVDTFGQNFYTPWNDLVFLLRFLCDAGYANRVIISIDSNWHWRDGKKIFEGADEPFFDPNAANRTFAYMITDAVPMLLKSGFSMKEINTFLIDNPRNYFVVN